MVFVITPVYEYDESSEVKEFNTKEEALEFIDKDLERNVSSKFQNGPNDYIVIEGRKIKLKIVQYVSKVVEDEDLKFHYEW